MQQEFLGGVLVCRVGGNHRREDGMTMGERTLLPAGSNQGRAEEDVVGRLGLLLLRCPEGRERIENVRGLPGNKQLVV